MDVGSSSSLGPVALPYGPAFSAYCGCLNFSFGVGERRQWRAAARTPLAALGDAGASPCTATWVHNFQGPSAVAEQVVAAGPHPRFLNKPLGSSPPVAPQRPRGQALGSSPTRPKGPFQLALATPRRSSPLGRCVPRRSNKLYPRKRRTRAPVLTGGPGAAPGVVTSKNV